MAPRRVLSASVLVIESERDERVSVFGVTRMGLGENGQGLVEASRILQRHAEHVAVSRVRRIESDGFSQFRKRLDNPLLSDER